MDNPVTVVRLSPVSPPRGLGVEQPQAGQRNGCRAVESSGERKRGRGRELMVLHLPGSMSILSLITLSKEAISLFPLSLSLSLSLSALCG